MPESKFIRGILKLFVTFIVRKIQESRDKDQDKALQIITRSFPANLLNS
ncbi:hypothetical protein SAMN05216524_104250 [Mucilaginibacter sp. OK098]|nr:hypothetical protein SAMN05216524_104250 [Mucilaginibacter sp. OK098]